MSDIIRKVAFLLVLAGLLTWGVATMAQGPAVVTNVSDTAIQLEGQVIENGVPVSRDQIQHVQ